MPTTYSCNGCGMTTADTDDLEKFCPECGNLCPDCVDDCKHPSATEVKP